MAWKRKRGRKWLVGWYFPPGSGIEFSRGGFPTAKDADRFIVEVEGLVARGVNWEPPRPVEPDEAARLDVAVAAHLDHVELTVGSPLTARQHTMSMKLFMRFTAETSTPPLLSSLSKALLTKFIGWLRDPATASRGTGRGNDHIRKTVQHVQQFWAWASADDEKFGRLTPAPRKLDELRNIQSPQKQTKAASFAVADSVIVQLGVERTKSRGRLQRDVAYHVLTACLTRCFGFRISQVERLQVGDIELDTDVLDFRGELGKSKSEKKGRRVPIAPVLMPILRRLCAGRAMLDPLVPRRSVAASGQNRRERVVEAWRAAGVPESIWKQRPNHAFRKCFYTGLIKLKASPAAVTFLVGQSSGLAGVYTDPDALELRGAVALVPDFTAEALATIERALSTTEALNNAERTQDGP